MFVSKPLMRAVPCVPIADFFSSFFIFFPLEALVGVSSDISGIFSTIVSGLMDLLLPDLLVLLEVDLVGYEIIGVVSTTGV